VLARGQLRVCAKRELVCALAAAAAAATSGIEEPAVHFIVYCQLPPIHLPLNQIRSLEALEEHLGAESDAVADLRRLFVLAEGYGFADWLVLDASVVRGLAYYTGEWVHGDLPTCVRSPHE